MSDQIVTPSAGAAPSIPDYELLRPIGRGAYGEVWLARNVTGSWVALKIVHRAAFDHDRPFEREFEGIKRFEPISRSDPSQVAILHVGLGDGFFYYVMELADDSNAECGTRSAESNLSAPSSIPHSALRTPNSYAPKTLKRLLNDRGALPADECIAIALSLTRALAHLHGHGLVHRDVKPSNVIFVNGQAKLADIGLVTSVDATRSFVGTEGYLPAEGAGTPQADLFALGKVLYEMSTGCDRKEFPALPPDIATRPDRDILAELNAIVVRACQIDPRERYANTDAMRADLELLRVGKSVKRKRAQFQRWVVYRKIGFAAALFAVVATLGLIAKRQFEPKPTGSRLQPSTNHTATVLYYQALRIIHADDCQRYQFAWSNLNVAVQLDTNFTAAYALMSQMSIGESWAIDLEDSMLTSRQLASRLMTLDNRLAESLCAQAWVQFYGWELDEAENSIKQAIALDPNCWLAHSLHGWFLCHWGHAERSRLEFQRAEELETAFAINQFCLGMPFYLERDYDAAANEFDKAIVLNKVHPFFRVWRGRVYRIKNDYPRAIEEYRKADIINLRSEAEATERARQLRIAFDKDGQRGYWQKQLELEQSKTSPVHYELAKIYAQLGEKDKAIDLLRQCVATSRGIVEEGPLTILLDDCWDGMRDDPEFKKLVAELKFPP